MQLKHGRRSLNWSREIFCFGILTTTYLASIHSRDRHLAKNGHCFQDMYHADAIDIGFLPKKHVYRQITCFTAGPRSLVL